MSEKKQEERPVDPRYGFEEPIPMIGTTGALEVVRLHEAYAAQMQVYQALTSYPGLDLVEDNSTNVVFTK